MPFGDTLREDVDGSWRVQTEIAQYFADRAAEGEVSVLRLGVGAVVPADVAVAGLRALGRDLPAGLVDEA